jgi:hypothetical protein
MYKCNTFDTLDRCQLVDTTGGVSPRPSVDAARAALEAAERLSRLRAALTALAKSAASIQSGVDTLTRSP